MKKLLMCLLFAGSLTTVVTAQTKGTPKTHNLQQSKDYVLPLLTSIPSNTNFQCKLTLLKSLKKNSLKTLIVAVSEDSKEVKIF